MSMHVNAAETAAAAPNPLNFAADVEMEAMFFRAQLIQQVMMEHFVLLALIQAMTMPQYRVFQWTFYEPEAEEAMPESNRPTPAARAEYVPPPATPKITPEATPETIAFLETKGVTAKNGDPYSFLGLTKDASLEDVKKAYKKLAVKLHPDKHKNDPQYVEPFRAIQEAYEMLNPDKR